MGKQQVAGAFLEPTGGVLSCAHCQHHDTTTDSPKLLAHCQLSCLPNSHKQKIPKITPSLSSCVRGKYTSRRPHGETNEQQANPARMGAGRDTLSLPPAL